MRLYQLFKSLLLNFRDAAEEAMPDAAVGSSAANYTGIYNLVSIYDSLELAAVEIPASNNFQLQLNPAKLDDPDDLLDPYAVNIEMGNTMWTQMNVTMSVNTDQIVGMDPIRSTRLLPSPEVWAVESAVNSILPLCTFIRFLDDEKTQLALDGPAGAMEWTRQVVVK
jgi:hypothetical protein